MELRDLWASPVHVVVVTYFLQDNMYIHSFSSVLAVKLGQLSLSNNLKSGVEMCLTMIGLIAIIVQAFLRTIKDIKPMAVQRRYDNIT